MKKILAIDLNAVYTKGYTVKWDEKTYVYIDYLNEDGTVIDSRLQTVDGYAVEIPSLFEEIQEFIDQEDCGD